jgi:hypothetical protein
MKSAVVFPSGGARVQNEAQSPLVDQASAHLAAGQLRQRVVAFGLA